MCSKSNSILALAGIMLAISAVDASAQDVRYFEQNGITYRETRNTVQQPVREITYQNQQETYYRQQITTQFQDYSQLAYQPVTTYQWEPRWHGWWRIFRGPHVAYHLVPRTSWHTTAQTVKVPITQAYWVPETRTVTRAVPQLRMVNKEHVTRTAVGPAANRSASNTIPTRPILAYQTPPVQNRVATTPPAYPSYGSFGGVARMESDPPRASTTVQYSPPSTILR